MPRCGPLNPLLMLRARGLAGPTYQQVRPGVCATGVGNYVGIGGPGSGPQAIRGVVIDGTTVEIVFSLCVSVPGPGYAGIEYRIDEGTWTEVTGATKVSDTVWRFTTGTIDPGDDVDWRYVGGSDTIVDCESPPEDIGDQQIPVNNPLVLAGNFILLETGGTDIFLLEDDTDQTRGFLTEDAT